VNGRVALARRTLFEDRRRAALAMAGVGSGLLMVILMTAIFAGFTKQETAYMDNSPADIVISQAGVNTMQMSTSSLALETVPAVRKVAGVAWVEPLRQTTSTITVVGSSTRLISYVFGFQSIDKRGGPRELDRGRLPGMGEIVIDRAGAEQLHVRMGDQVEVFGRSLTISGLTRGLTSVANTTAFITAAQYAQIAGPGVNYLLVGAAPGTTPAELAERLSNAVPNVTVQTRTEFSGQEARLVEDMYTDVIRTMTGIGFVIALALVALTLSAVTSSNIRAYGVVKALGATRGRLTSVVATQAVWAVLSATAIATALAYVLSLIIGATVPNIEMVIEPSAVVFTLAGALVVGAPASLLPLRRVLRVDPASAFRS
jgi:putative ABC transport system permease protein